MELPCPLIVAQNPAMAHIHHPLAVVTAASSGIGLQLAHQCAGAGFDLVIVADRPLDFAMKVLTDRGAAVEAIEADLSTTRGVDALLARLEDRRVDALLANAGACQAQNASTLHLVRSIARRMRKRGQGKILITGSIPGCRTLRKELKDSGVTVNWIHGHD